MMKSLGGLLVAVFMVVLSAPALAQNDDNNVVDVSVMSQNLYIGADLDRILQGEPPSAIFETALATNYPGRAAEIAKTIGTEKPDLVGIQEATLITVLTNTGKVLFEIDYLEILVGQLNAQGYSYVVSSELTNADVTLPLTFDETGSPLTLARVVDRDAIIHNTETTTVAGAKGRNFSTNFTFELGGFPVEFTRGYTAVDATVDDQTFLFVNTHLEVEGAPCFTPTGVVICQDVQAVELLEAIERSEYRSILVGDFNAKPGTTAYETVVAGGYVDTWNGDSDTGFTCCQTELLNNPVSELDERIDHIFVQKQGVKLLSANTMVLGDDRLDPPIPPGAPQPPIDGGILWSSDHGAPFAQLELKIGKG